MSYLVINGDCLEALQTLDPVTCIFADPPDNIGLGYASIKDTMTEDEYTGWLKEVVWACVNKAEICWFSFNARWTFHMGSIFLGLKYAGFEIKPCVQVFKFGNYNSKDLTNCHRPLWRAMKHNAILYPEQIKIESVRQKMGDKRAQQGGKVPGDTIEIGSHLSETEVMEIYLATGSRGSLAKQYGVTSATVQAIKNGLAFAHITNRIAMADVERAPRITGNSKQRRSWHPTQLNEHLVERCIKFSTKEGDTVLDPFGGTGTTLRVCKRLNRPCTLIEHSEEYCKHIAEENGLEWDTFSEQYSNSWKAAA